MNIKIFNSFSVSVLIIHMIFILLISILILVLNKYDSESMMLWIFPMGIDYPFSKLYKIVSQIENNFPTQLWSGLSGNVPNFLFPFIFFFFLGSAWWFLLSNILKIVVTYILRLLK